MGGSGDLAPRAGELHFAVFCVDADLVEESSVELAPSFVRGDGVDGCASLHEVSGLLERGRELGAGGFVAGLFGAGGELFAGNALLFAAQQIDGDSFGVGEFEQLARLLVQLGQSGTGSGDSFEALVLATGDLGSKLGGHGVGVDAIKANVDRPRPL